MPAISFAAAAAASADKPDPSVVAREQAMRLLDEQGHHPTHDVHGQGAGPSSPPNSTSRQDTSTNDQGNAEHIQEPEDPETSPKGVSSSSSEYRIKHLILDASPLLTQAPIQALRAQNIYIVPQVVAELKDPKARQHLEWLKMQGQNISVMEGGSESLLKVIAFAKLTGDYAVLSTADLAVLALTHALEVKEHGAWRLRDQVGGKTGQQKHEAEKVQRMREEGKLPVKEKETVKGVKGPASSDKGEIDPHSLSKAEASEAKADSQGAGSKLPAEEEVGSEAPGQSTQPEATHIADLSANSTLPGVADEHAATENAESTGPAADGEDSDEGEWITADNLQEHKNLALGVVTQESKHDKDAAVEVAQTFDSSSAAAEAGVPRNNGKGKGKARTHKPMTVACITSDYAVQNVMLQMGLSLISMSGQRITQVKSWVLRCHACMKLCKDQERKFCPSCGNPTLLRTSVTSVAPGSKPSSSSSSAISGTAASMGLQVHLKKNFQYKNRGTIYSLPTPKPSSASAMKAPSRGGQPRGAVPILREDQLEWQRAVQKDKIRREKAEKQMQKAIEKSGGKKDALSARYDDPDWMPDAILTADKGRRAAGGLPAIGAGRKNPNEKRRPRG